MSLICGSTRHLRNCPNLPPGRDRWCCLGSWRVAGPAFSYVSLARGHSWSCLLRWSSPAASGRTAADHLSWHGRMSGTRWRVGGVGSAEEAADSMADVEVVRECGGLGRRPRVKPDVDAVALAAVRVIHPYSDLASGVVVAVGQHLVVETEVRRAGGSHRHHPEGRRGAVVEVGRDLRPLRLDCAPRQAPVDDDALADGVEAGVAVGQVHPLVVLGHPCWDVPG